MRRGLPLKPPETDAENASCLIKWDVTSHHTPVNVPETDITLSFVLVPPQPPFFYLFFLLKPEHLFQHIYISRKPSNGA